MPLNYIEGDLLEAEVDFIVQQNCCTAVKAHGLSETIAIKWPSVNPYKDRRKFKGNWAIVEDRPLPGTIEIYEFDKPSPMGGVICAFAQYNHGRSGRFHDPLELDKKYGDDPIDRIRYFKSCLDVIAGENPQSIGLPYKIGCGLSGGSWTKYESIIEQWSTENPDIDITIYKLPN